MKTYKIKGGQKLFNKWMNLKSKTNGPLTAMYLFQNDGEISSDNLNEWYQVTQQEIAACEQEMQRVILDMKSALAESVLYIKSTNR